MASSGPLSPGTGTTATIPAWVTPENIVSSNDTRATATDNSAGAYISGHLLASNFGFAIPAGATIDGVVLEIERHANVTTQSPRDHTIRLMKVVDTPVGDNKATGTTWATTDEYITYGSSSDKWGTTWTVAEINDTGFGAYIVTQTSAGKGGPQFRVDHVRITVYYTEITFRPKTTFIT